MGKGKNLAAKMFGKLKFGRKSRSKKAPKVCRNFKEINPDPDEKRSKDMTVAALARWIKKTVALGGSNNLGVRGSSFIETWSEPEHPFQWGWGKGGPARVVGQEQPEGYPNPPGYGEEEPAGRCCCCC